MASKLIIAKLTDADLHRFRVADARIDTARIMPQAFGSDAIEAAFLRWYELRGEFAESYALPEDGQWDISLATGAIYPADD